MERILDLKKMKVFKISAARETVLNRQEQIKKLWFLEHKTVQQIAKELGWHHQTIVKDIEKIRKRFYREITIEPVEKLISECKAKYDFIEKECVESIKDNPRGKFRYLEILKEIQIKKLDILERLGIVEKIPQVNININKYEDDLEKAREKWKQSLLIKKRKQESSQHQ